MRPICRVLILLVFVSGCATVGYEPPEVVSETDWKRCEEFAQVGAELHRMSSGRIALRMFLVPDWDELLRPGYDAAMRDCLEPVLLAQILGPDRPELAASLSRLATGYARLGEYAEAEPLYKRALALQEEALGREHFVVALTLDGYATMLREMNREAEAAQMEARAKAIRATYGQQNPTK